MYEIILRCSRCSFISSCFWPFLTTPFNPRLRARKAAHVGGHSLRPRTARRLIIYLLFLLQHWCAHKSPAATKTLDPHVVVSQFETRPRLPPSNLLRRQMWELHSSSSRPIVNFVERYCCFSPLRVARHPYQKGRG